MRNLSRMPEFPEWQPARACRMVETGRFNFLNRTNVGGDGIPWSNDDLPRLWIYHLNYFDFLNVDVSHSRHRSILCKMLLLMTDWCEQNPTGREVAWEPYPLSLRIVNWLKFLLRNSAQLNALGAEAAVVRMLCSLRSQTLRLERKLEFHLRANHLLKNAKAMMFAGALLETGESGRWWEKGSTLLKQQLAEQILADGGHFERSPMYHVQVLEDLLDLRELVSVAGTPIAWEPLLSEKIAKMAEFLAAILHPDNEIPLLNDSAFGVARPAAEVLSRAGRPMEPFGSGDGAVKVLPETGYGVIRDSNSKSFLVFDCGPLGPDYQPGHGHCDVLSYELSLHGQRVIVDTGVSTYEAGAERHYERSTAAHNTLRIDGTDQAEIWASFRVGRRPRVGPIERGAVDGLHFVCGEHYGYEHLGVIHSRTIVHRPAGFWLIVDLLRGTGSHKVESFIHFHPGISVVPCGQGAWGGQNEFRRWVIRCNGRAYRVVLFGGSAGSLQNTCYAPEFGLRQSRWTLWQMWQGQLPVSLACVLLPLGEPLPEIHLHADLGTVQIDRTSIPLFRAES